MKVYRGQIEEFRSNVYFPLYKEDGVFYTSNDKAVKTYLQPQLGTIAHTGPDFATIAAVTNLRPAIVANKYYRFYELTNDGWMKWEEVSETTAHGGAVHVVAEIMEWQYNDKDMGERSITTKIQSSECIDFRVGDYVEIQTQTLMRNGYMGSVDYEKFFIYALPTVKKIARAGSVGDAFEQDVTFYPRQYELGNVMIRDFIQERANQDKIIYTGFDKVTFYGGAYELLERCMACLRENGYVDNDGNDLWSYDLADAVNEQKNTSLERYAFAFDGSYIQDALLKLNSEDYVNTTWFINGRKIYVGYKRPYMCCVGDGGNLVDNPLKLTYGKTSHQPINLDHGGLFDITKSFGKESPITKLFAYGATRNLNRYYDSDRIHSGRYVTNLMLPSFGDDGVTDYIINEEAAAKYGIREGKKQFDEIYPSLRYMTYADIRGIKYCIKVRYSGLLTDKWTDGIMDHNNAQSSYPIARVQCYKVTPCFSSITGLPTGHNKLVAAAPPVDIVVIIHALGKVVKVKLCGGARKEDAITKQIQQDGKVPTTNGVTPAIGSDYSHVYEGSCFAVHHNGWADMDGQTYSDETRATWFQIDNTADNSDTVAYMHRIEYVDTFWATDVYEFESFTQHRFRRDGYSLWAWPRLNNDSGQDDSLLVNEVVAVEPVVIPDTSANIDGGRQNTFDIYLRDVGFAIDEQNDFGEMVFVYDNVKVSVLDGLMEGREFDIDGQKFNGHTDRICCALKEDGSEDRDNPTGFFSSSGYTDTSVPAAAYANGAIWRLRLNRQNVQELEALDIIVPSTRLQMDAGAHIVLLDIYMPDVYVYAAEQRLLREATKYLNKVSKADVDYSVTFDKVRIQQIPNYPLQMRAGLNMRLVDTDLNISSQNTIRNLVDNIIGEKYSVPLYTTERNVSFANYDAEYMYYCRRSGTSLAYRGPLVLGSNPWLAAAISPSSEMLQIKLPYQQNDVDVNSVIIRWRHNNIDNVYTYIWKPQIISKSISGDNWLLVVEASKKTLEKLADMGYTIEFTLSTKYSIVTTKQYNNAGVPVYAKCRHYLQFTASKYYEVTMDVNTSLVANGEWINFEDETHENALTYAGRYPDGDTGQYKAWKSVDGESVYYTEETYEEGFAVFNSQLEHCGEILFVRKDSFALFGFLDDESGMDVYRPEYTEEVITEAVGVPAGYTRMKFSFYLDSSFNDDHGYYPSVKYMADGDTEYAYIYLISVVEKDMDAEGNVIDYADMIAESVTIKVYENTRDANTRVLGAYPEPIREVSATLKEKTVASQWTTMQNKIDETRIEVEANRMSYENLANNARIYYRELLSLRDNIFDPDGTCDQTFLHIMMLQVGADSMNYQLDKTFYTIDRVLNESTGLYEIKEVMHNFTIQKQNGVDHFIVYQDDTLRHFVYTAGSQGGSWRIKGSFDATLASVTETIDGEQVTTWPVYYVSIKCKKDIQNLENEVQWQCTVKQYAVNDPEDTSCWYFNWGILQPDGNGNYSLIETRGNAYMYGDSLIAGTIRTLAGNSYFDLTHGNFVLTQGTADDAALSYINGVLTINGYKSDTLIQGIIERLGLGELMSVNNNIFDNDGELYWGTARYNYVQSYFRLVQNAKNGRYIIAYDKIESLYRRDPSSSYPPGINTYSYPLKSLTVSIGYYDATDTYIELVSSVHIEGFRTIITLPIDSSIVMFLRGEIHSDYLGTVQTPVVHTVFTNMVVQYYDYNTYFRHLTDALKGSTEISGGLVLTNLIMLRNERNDVVAGMSGLTDNSRVPGEESEGVTLFSGGTYADALAQAQAAAQGTLDQMAASLLPILITKTGIGSKIGCFEIVDENSAAVYNSNRTSRLLFTAGTPMSMSMQIKSGDDWVERLTISDESVDVKYKFYTMHKVPDSSWAYKVKSKGVVLSRMICPWSISLPTISSGQSYDVTITQSHKLRVDFQTELSGWSTRKAYIDAKVGFCKIYRNSNNEVTSYDELILKPRTGISAKSTEGGNLAFELQLFDYTTPLTSGGEYGIILDFLTMTLENGAGISSEESYYNDDFKNSIIRLGLSQDIHFSIIDSSEQQTMRIGRDGMKITANSSSFFIVKNDGTNIDIRMNGLPTSATGLAAKRIYVDGTTLKLS